MKPDKIKIEDLEVFANHGVFPEENVLGQKFVVSAVMYMDTRRAGLTDELTASIHYGEASAFITEYLKSHTFKLLEKVAEGLAEEMLVRIAGLQKVQIEIKKPWAPVGLPLKTVSVEIEREWHTAYIALGSNMGDSRSILEAAVQALDEMKNTKVEKVSTFITTPPYGVTDQPGFLNGCLKLSTLLYPEELLKELNRIEKEAGRERTGSQSKYSFRSRNGFRSSLYSNGTGCFFVGTLLMAVLANYPFALAPGMGLNAYFAYTVVIGMGYSWQYALTAVFAEGIIFIVLSMTNVREAIFNAIPRNLKSAVSVGIGLFIAFVGMQNAHIVIGGSTLIELFSLDGYNQVNGVEAAFSDVGITVLLAIIGVIITGILVIKNVKRKYSLGYPDYLGTWYYLPVCGTVCSECRGWLLQPAPLISAMVWQSQACHRSSASLILRESFHWISS